LIPYLIKKDEIIKQLETNPVNGLTSSSALSRLEQYGKNKLKEPKKKRVLSRGSLTSSRM
jgi:Ca2+-transporting ATPase